MAKVNLENDKIDVVITWLDGKDPDWAAEKASYENEGVDGSSNSAARWRDWNNLQYIFRGIERYMPWVNKVHFVTWGHIPKWLNTKHPKLHIVYHSDFIPAQYLPTFNSSAISLNLYKIPGLTEQFIYFDDDMFIIGPLKSTDFFEEGKPKDMAVLSPMPLFYDTVCATEANNLGIINKYFTMQDIKKEWRKWYSLKNGKYLIRTLLFSRFHTILGIFETHIPHSYLRRSFLEVWEKEPEILKRTCKNKFRTSGDVNHWLVRYWQIMEGNFKPRRWDFGTLADLPEGEERAVSLMSAPGKTKLLCINDTSRIINFEKTRDRINRELDKCFPQKSSFEIP